MNNVAPVVSAGADTMIYSGTKLLVNASFTDVGMQDKHTATIDWGDGTPLESRPVTQGAGFGSLSGEHRYTELGFYTVTICVTDDDTVQGCDPLRLEVQRLPVSIDIEPESLGLRSLLSNDVLKAELLARPDFPALTVLQDTVRFGYTGFEAAPERLNRNPNKAEFHFSRSVLGIPGGTAIGINLPLYMTGRLQDGTLFIGSDTVRTVP